MTAVPAVLAQVAVVAAVAEIDDQSDDEPGDQSNPVDRAELIDHIAVKRDPENRHERDQGSTERASLLRVRAAKHHDRDANEDESKQGADVDHLAEVVDGDQAADDCGE